MPTTCPQCGASLPEGADCQTLFDELLVLEFTNPAYGEVHMLTVSCYMIQHGRYSDTALAWMAEKLRLALDEGVSPDQIRRQANREADQQSRGWKVTRQPGERALPRIDWSLTIADVAAHRQDPADYCAWVRRWAAVTRSEMQPWLQARGTT